MEEFIFKNDKKKDKKKAFPGHNNCFTTQGFLSKKNLKIKITGKKKKKTPESG